ncbi:unnamed protein product [Ectocarpus sp. 6 AP-2014]
MRMFKTGGNAIILSGRLLKFARSQLSMSACLPRARRTKGHFHSPIRISRPSDSRCPRRCCRPSIRCPRQCATSAAAALWRTLHIVTLCRQTWSASPVTSAQANMLTGTLECNRKPPVPKAHNTLLLTGRRHHLPDYLVTCSTSFDM